MRILCSFLESPSPIILSRVIHHSFTMYPQKLYFSIPSLDNLRYLLEVKKEVIKKNAHKPLVL